MVTTHAAALDGRRYRCRSCPVSYTHLDVYKRQDGERFEVESGDEGLEIFVLAGEPLNEPVVKQGPYVMTNKTELLLAYGEYINGKFGREEAIM